MTSSVDDLMLKTLRTIDRARVRKGRRPLGAAFSYGKREAREREQGSHEDVLRHANRWLRDNGHEPVKKGLIDLYRALSVEERRDYGLLLERGFSPDEARALAMAGTGAPVHKADSSAKTYHQHYVEHAANYLPQDVHQAIHKLARGRTGGLAKAEAARVSEAQIDAQEEAQHDDVAELWRKRLKQDAGKVPGSDSEATQVAKGGPSLDEVGGEGAPRGSKLKFQVKWGSADDLKPPKGVQSACRRGLELAPEYGGQGLTDGAKARARRMAAGEAVSPDQIRRMKSFFARHGSYAKEASPPSPGYVSWLLWGGDAGATWASSQADKLTEKSQAITKRAAASALADDLLKNFSSAPHAFQLEKKTAVAPMADALLASVLKSVNFPADDASPAPGHGEAYTRLWSAQELVSRMDEALASGAATVEEARRRASDQMARQSTSDGKVPTSGIGSGNRAGLRLDLNAGPNRHAGFLSLDTYPHDFGTVLHDIDLGLPVPDGTVDAVRALNIAASRPSVAKQPLELLSEIQRALMVDGEVFWQGPAVPDAVWEQLPGLQWLERETLEDGQQAVIARRVLAKLPSVYGADVGMLGRSEEEHGDIARASQDFGLKPPPAEVAMANLLTKSQDPVRASYPVQVLKKDSWEQIVYGVVLAPEQEDSQGDIISAPEIQKTAHRFLATQMVGHEHLGPMEGATVVESYIAPQDLFFPNAMDGTQTVPKGSWVLGVHIGDSERWQDVLDGRITGFSVGGFGDRIPMDN